jgi:hypothetical protein
VPARVGMAERDARALCDAVKLEVSYTFNQQPAARIICATRAGGSFASFTFVDNVVTEIADLGRLSLDNVGGD